MAKPGSASLPRGMLLGRPEVGLLVFVCGQHEAVTGVHACDRCLQGIYSWLKTLFTDSSQPQFWEAFPTRQDCVPILVQPRPAESMFHILFVSAHFPALAISHCLHLFIYMSIYEGEYMLKQIAMVRLLLPHLLLHGILLKYGNHLFLDHTGERYVICYWGCSNSWPAHARVSPQ